MKLTTEERKELAWVIAGCIFLILLMSLVESI
jgi:hypothetical protein